LNEDVGGMLNVDEMLNRNEKLRTTVMLINGVTWTIDKRNTYDTGLSFSIYFINIISVYYIHFIV